MESMMSVDSILQADLQQHGGGGGGMTSMGHNSEGFGISKLYEEERKELAREESRAVQRIRIVAYVVAIVAGISGCLAVYFVTRNSQKHNFEIQFAAFGEKVVTNFYESIERKIGSIHVLSTTITSHAVDTGSVFPNVTIPHFEYHGANTRIQSDSVLFYYSPVVTAQTRAGWESYAATNRYSVIAQLRKEKALKFKQDSKYGTHNNINNNNNRLLQEEVINNITTTIEEEGDKQVEFADGYHYRIWEADNGGAAAADNSSRGPFVPIWQMTPAIQNLSATMNFDLTTHPAVGDALHATIDSEQVVMSQTHDLQHTEADNNNDTGESMLYNAFLVSGQYRHVDQTEYQNDPTTNIIYPVFDSFGPDRTIGGILMSSMYWRLNFVDILPETAKGVTCVMKNSLDQTFTYVIDGPTVTYLGPGDHHDSKYDDMVVSEDVTEKLLANAGPQNRGFDAADLNTEHCRYQLFVYPSQDTEDEYVNHQPILFATGVACLFVFTSIVFIAYDTLVARRQKIIEDKAVESAVIVSSLYPKHVRERMFENDNNNNNKIETAAAERKEESNQKTSFFKLPSLPTRDLGPPIADYYDASTVLFADLAGFTKWSSSRNASDVFQLLESLYLSFDKIAARRNVFKVETVGDCYVAVTGVPEPQEDHALIMVKFARDCYRKMNQLLPALADKLGPDTSTLQFRVGMHSGPITGGVLRGAKSRFQLFGDTINTASRMESNGVPGRIHVSQETADQLIALGYDYWLELRKDKIVAKGKGELHTFFVSIEKNPKSTATADTTSNETSPDALTREHSFPDLFTADDEEEADKPPTVSFDLEESSMSNRDRIKEYLESGPEFQRCKTR